MMIPNSMYKRSAVHLVRSGTYATVALMKIEMPKSPNSSSNNESVKMSDKAKIENTKSSTTIQMIRPQTPLTTIQTIRSQMPSTTIPMIRPQMPSITIQMIRPQMPSITIQMIRQQMPSITIQMIRPQMPSTPIQMIMHRRR